jgi:hypothetical protein
MKGRYRRAFAIQAFGNRRCHFAQRHRAFIERQLVEIGAVDRGKTFEPVERTFLFKYQSVTFERERRIENACTSAGGFLRRQGMRRAVRAEEIFRIARYRRFAQRQPVKFPLCNRQALSVGANAAGKHGVAINV